MFFAKASAFGLLLSLCCLQAPAQKAVKDAPPLNEPDLNKPAAFADLPKKMRLQPTELEDLLTLPIGTAVSARVSEGFLFRGTVISRSDARDASVKSVVIRSSERQGATFTFTRTAMENGSFAYLGRIISMKHGDAYELVFENGQYVLEKKSLYDLISE